MDPRLADLLSRQQQQYLRTLASTYFELRLYEPDQRRPVLQLHSKQRPSFEISEKQLPSNVSYVFVVQASNEFGRSSDVVLTTQTHRMLRSKVPSSPPHLPSKYRNVNLEKILVIIRRQI